MTPTRGTCPQNVGTCGTSDLCQGPRLSTIHTPGVTSLSWKSPDSFHHLPAQTALLHTHYVQTYAPLHSYTRSKYTLRHKTHSHVTDVYYTQRHHHMLRHTCTHIDTWVHLCTDSSAPVCIPTHTQTHAPRYTNTRFCPGAQTPSKYHHFTMLAQLWALPL